MAVGNNLDTSMQRYIDLAFEPPPTRWFTRSKSWDSAVPSAERKNYVMEKICPDQAVVLTDSERAAHLTQPSVDARAPDPITA